MKLFRSVTQLLTTAILHSGRERARRALLQMSHRQLNDTGFSKDLLEAGVHTWPWRDDATLINTPIVMSTTPARRLAVKELRAYSDRDLSDLGLSRVTIEMAVAHGRPGIDDKRQAA